jgi:c(7)-type cytochrome triheme protein
MHRLRQFLVLFVICLLAVSMQKGAYSQFRKAQVETAAPVQETAHDESRPATADEGADQNRFYDPRNPDHGTLQKAEEMRATLPLDKRGAIDWMKALRSGAIKPRTDLGENKRHDVLNLDIILKNTKEMPYVRFPHNSHTEWLACSNCHDSLFIPKAGANEITMEKIFRGQFCGVCHDRVAFVTHNSCERCHSVPHANSKQWW